MTDRIPLVMKIDDWPQADRIAWDALFASGDFFDDTGPCARWSAGSRRKRQQGYGQWISYLKRSNPAALSYHPVERITELRVRTYVDECEARLAPKSTAGLMLDLLIIAEALGPTEDWSWLRVVVKRLRCKANSHSLPAPHPISATEIFQWSL